ncbi:MAG TPA: hypothetical protein VKA46_24010 [Gemmataceae bacterium]|nr:hypothetical protein [Gemmataceae bacterium]
MTFKNDFLTALRAGKGYHALMELVRHHRVQGLSVDAAYQALHEIWLEHGFDNEVAEEGTLQDTLEAVMEKVWYGQPVL